MDRAFLEVNVDALRHNIEQINRSIGRSKIMAVVKDQCYGLGLEAAFYCQELGIDFFAVATIDEAIQLRQFDIYQPILIFGYTHPTRFDDLRTYNLIQTAISYEYLLLLENFQKGIEVHLKINTGMNRLGIPYDFDLIESFFTLKNIKITGIYTHLLSSDQPGEGHKKSIEQLSLFDKLLGHLDNCKLNYGLTHVHNSAGIVYFGDSYVYDYVRPGLLLAASSRFDNYREVVTLKARVAMVKEVSVGENIGYGVENTLNKSTKVATVTIGYGDGLQRRLAQLGFKLRVSGQWCRVIGRICMDQLLIDVSDVNVDIGDVVEIIHDEFTVDDMADLLGSIPNEVLTQLGSRIERVLVYDDKESL